MSDERLRELERAVARGEIDKLPVIIQKRKRNGTLSLTVLAEQFGLPSLITACVHTDTNMYDLVPSMVRQREDRELREILRRHHLLETRRYGGSEEKTGTALKFTTLDDMTIPSTSVLLFNYIMNDVRTETESVPVRDILHSCERETRKGEPELTDVFFIRSAPFFTEDGYISDEETDLLLQTARHESSLEPHKRSVLHTVVKGSHFKRLRELTRFFLFGNLSSVCHRKTMPLLEFFPVDYLENCTYQMEIRTYQSKDRPVLNVGCMDLNLFDDSFFNHIEAVPRIAQKLLGAPAEYHFK